MVEESPDPLETISLVELLKQNRIKAEDGNGLPEGLKELVSSKEVSNSIEMIGPRGVSLTLIGEHNLYPSQELEQIRYKNNGDITRRTLKKPPLIIFSQKQREFYCLYPTPNHH